MAGYTLLRSGSTGEDVKKLQNALIGAGYDVGQSGADGIYGANTESAVRKYQQDNGLSVDGIAGEQTMGKLFGNMNKPSVQGAETQGTQSPVPDYSQYQYDPTANKAYLEALAALQQAQKTMPTYQGTYDQQLQDLYEQIVNREKFSYDLNADALYQQYRDQYTQQGKLAMMDTMGQAQAMTGGYGNSYAQSVGQQTYQGYLQQLNDVVPELYGMALDQYNQEGQNLLNQYSMLGDLADTEYARYQDALDQYWQNLTYQKQLVDDAYDQGYTNWYQSYQMGADADNTAYQKQQDAYEKLVSLITSTGYTPTEEELKAAGMSSSQAKSYADYYKKQNGNSGYSSGSGRSGGSGGYSESNGYTEYDGESDGTTNSVNSTQGSGKQLSPYADLVKTLDEITSTGEAEKQEISGLIQSAVQSGAINQKQAQQLLNHYANRGVKAPGKQETEMMNKGKKMTSRYDPLGTMSGGRWKRGN